MENFEKTAPGNNAYALAHRNEEGIRSEIDTLNRQLLELEIRRSQPDTTSENWKLLGSGIGLMVFRDRNGTLRGTLYLKSGEYRQPIAVEGVEKLGSPVVPGTGNRG